MAIAVACGVVSASFVCGCAAPQKMDQTNPILSSRDEKHMLGHGFYNEHSHQQGKANTYGLPLLVDAVKTIDFLSTNDWTN